MADDFIVKPLPLDDDLSDFAVNVPSGDIQPLPLGDIEPLPLGDIDPLPLGDIDPLPLGDIEPLSLGDIQPLPIDDEPTYNAAPSVLDDDAPIPGLVMYDPLAETSKHYREPAAKTLPEIETSVEEPPVDFTKVVAMPLSLEEYESLDDALADLNEKTKTSTPLSEETPVNFIETVAMPLSDEMPVNFTETVAMPLSEETPVNFTETVAMPLYEQTPVNFTETVAMPLSEEKPVNFTETVAEPVEKTEPEPFEELAAPPVLFDPFAYDEEEEDPNAAPIPGLVIFEPTVAQPSVEEAPIVEEAPKVYDENIDFSLDDVMETQRAKLVSQTPPQLDTRFDDIEEISFDDVKVEKTAKKSLDDIAAPVFDRMAENQKQKSTLDDVEDVTFTEAEYKVEKKTLDDIDAPVLAVDETPKTDYKPKFVDPSLEEAKKSAKANANKAALSSNEVDPKKALASMREFQREQEMEMSKKGFRLVLLFMFFGLIACASLYLFSTEIITGFSDGATFSNKIRPYVPYACGVSALFTVMLMVPSGGLKGFTSFLYFLMFGVSIMCCFMLFGKEGNFFINLAMVAVPLVLFLVSLIVLSSNDKIEMYYKHKDV